MNIVKAERLLRRCMKEPFCINFEEFREAIKIILEARDILIKQNIEYSKTLENLQKNTIHKDKIREKLQELRDKEQELSDEQGYWGSADILAQIDILEKLLEEE